MKYQKLLYKYKQQIAELQNQLDEKKKIILQLKENLSQCELDRKFEQEKKNLAFKKLTERSEQLKSQPAEICQELIDMLTDRAELIEAGLCAEFMFTIYDLRESVEEILKEYQK